jgi:hypothetical protein
MSPRQHAAAGTAAAASEPRRGGPRVATATVVRWQLEARAPALPWIAVTGVARDAEVQEWVQPAGLAPPLAALFVQSL